MQSLTPPFFDQTRRTAELSTADSLPPADGRTCLERLDDEARKLLLAIARPVKYEEGLRLVCHGDPSRGTYVLREGAAGATVLLPGGEKLTVAKLELSGMCFGGAAATTPNRGTTPAGASPRPHAIPTSAISGVVLGRGEYPAG